MTAATAPADTQATAPQGSETPVSGGCQCGQIRYEITGQPREIYVCHCRECRNQSASAFGISVIIDSANLHLRQGQPQRWSRPTDSGKTLDCYFCPHCGSRLWHGDKDAAPIVSVKGGSLDQPPDLSTAIHIWTSRKLPGIILPPGAVHYPEEPDED